MTGKPVGEEYMTLDGYAIMVGTIRRLCSRNHSNMVAKEGYGEIFYRLMQAEESIRKRMQVVRYGIQTPEDQTEDAETR